MNGCSAIHLARVWDGPGAMVGARLLVDRLWPRGVSKDKLRLDGWLRDLAPSTGLRKWYGHDPARWDEFRHRYFAELDANPEAVAQLLERCRTGPVTLIYGAKDRDRNQAVVLREYLAKRL